MDPTWSVEAGIVLPIVRSRKVLRPSMFYVSVTDTYATTEHSLQSFSNWTKYNLLRVNLLVKVLPKIYPIWTFINIISIPDGEYLYF